jgi:hypothetical protein
MPIADARRTRLMKRSAGLRFETLEDRCLLSGKTPPQITIQETPATIGVPGTTMLLITGTNKNDSISISDNGTGKTGNIFVSLSDGRDYVSTGAVSEIGVATGKGNDRVTYELDGNLQPDVQELVFVGSNAKQGGGSVEFTVNIVGKVLDGASLGIIGFPDPKKTTTMTVNDSGEIDGSLTAVLAPLEPKSPSGGPEVYNFSSTATIAPDGDLTTGFKGSHKNDIGNVSYSGTNDGEFDVIELGNGGNDQLGADVYMIPGSTGTVGSSSQPSVLQTSGKKDELRFTIHWGTDSTTATGIFAKVIDTSKKDTSTHTANVTAKTKGSDTIVS